MNKRFLFAALAAVALTMGFTACDDDDDVDAGKYEMNVFLRLNQVSSDEAESNQIFETYRTSLGITDQEEMIVAVTGKDSLDCVNTVAEKCAKAEALLDGQQWSGLTAISVSIPAEKDYTLLYAKTFGKAADNTDRPFIVSFHGGGSGGIQGKAATAMCVQVQNGSKKGWAGDYPYYANVDLNLNTRGKYIYAMFDTEGVTSFKDLQQLVLENDHSEELNKYIADVKVVISDSYPSDFHEFTYEGATYKYAHGIYGDPVMWDMNMGAGGPYLLLFYSTDAVKFQRVIDIDECVFAHRGQDRGEKPVITIWEIGKGPWDFSDFVNGLRYKNGNVYYEQEWADFNMGCKDIEGDRIEMRADYISFDHLKRLKFDENGNAIKN